MIQHMNDIDKILNEVIAEQQISPYVSTDFLKNYIREGIYEIEKICEAEVDFDYDLHARRILKGYVLYANHKLLAEWKERYISDLIELQEKYYKDTSVS